MILQERIEVLVKLGKYLKNNSREWMETKEKAHRHNGWFTPEFVQLAADNIADNFLEEALLKTWTLHYHIDDNILPKNVGIIMAGNIPMVGFHDLLCVFASGHYQTIKLSSKDDVLIKHLVQKMAEWDTATTTHIAFADMLKNCDAYIATGSGNSAGIFQEYFSKYPNIIRRNKTSAAILTGKETAPELIALADDIHLYFGLGCRNVTKIYLPENYNFEPLLQAFQAYTYFSDHHKYKNNYDYQLSIFLLNKVYYMTNGTTLLVENDALFTPISVVNYSFYTNNTDIENLLKGNDDVQCITGNGFLPFGSTQQPGLFSYADAVDVMQFLLSL